MIKKSKKYMFKDNMAIVFFTILSLFILMETMVDSSLKGELSFIVPKYIMILFILYFIVKKTFIEDIKILCSKHSLYNNILKDKSFLKLISISIIWIIFIFILINYQLGESNNLSSLIKLEDNKSGLKLNEWGDFFAGFVAPITLLWVGFGIFYQMEEFKKVVESFEKQQRILNAQATQVEMQKNYMWYDRNINKFIESITKIEKTLDTNKNNSPELINKDFIIPENGNKYLDIFVEIKKIVDLDKYISNSLEKKIIKSSDTLKESLMDLKEEYIQGFGIHVKNSKELLLKVIFCTSLCDIEIRKGEIIFLGYKKFEIWLTSALKDKILIELLDIKNLKSTIIEDKTNNLFKTIINEKELLNMIKKEDM